MASRLEDQQEEVRLRVMRLMSENPELPSSRRARSRMRLENFKQHSRKGQYAHVLTPRGLSEKAALRVDFLRRKIVEYEALREEITALEREAVDEEGLSSLAGR